MKYGVTQKITNSIKGNLGPLCMNCDYEKSFFGGYCNFADKLKYSSCSITCSLMYLNSYIQRKETRLTRKKYPDYLKLLSFFI
jgi:hypothetical protein